MKTPINHALTKSTLHQTNTQILPIVGKVYHQQINERENDSVNIPEEI